VDPIRYRNGIAHINSGKIWATCTSASPGRDRTTLKPGAAVARHVNLIGMIGLRSSASDTDISQPQFARWQQYLPRAKLLGTVETHHAPRFRSRSRQVWSSCRTMVISRRNCRFSAISSVMPDDGAFSDHQTGGPRQS
jgi:hypothetical protein